MRSESTSAFGQPRLTMPTLGADLEAGDVVISRVYRRSPDDASQFAIRVGGLSPRLGVFARSARGQGATIRNRRMALRAVSFSFQPH
jgi:hypothetical protein